MDGFKALLGALLIVPALAHMQLHYPAPFNASNNPHRTSEPDPYLQYPYDCCGPGARWEYPCRGYLSLLGTLEGAPTATWQAGSKQSWNISGIGNHYGGSCQVGFSTDKGKTFRVAHSYEGNCPHRHGGSAPAKQNFDFFVPNDLEAGIQVFAWIWYNREQEFNMNCAAVNITANIAPADDPLPSVGESALPTITTVSDSTTTSTRVILTSTTTTITITVDHKQRSTSTSATSDVVPNKGKKLCHSAALPSTSVSTAASSSTEGAAPEATEGSPQLFQTANGCSCTCVTPANITTCTCYCNQQDSDSNPAHHRRHPHDRIHGRADSMASQPESKQPQWMPFDKRPLMFIADDGNGCLTPHTIAELKYPDPGPNVQIGDGEYPLELPYGNCTTVVL